MMTRGKTYHIDMFEFRFYVCSKRTRKKAKNLEAITEAQIHCEKNDEAMSIVFSVTHLTFAPHQTRSMLLLCVSSANVSYTTYIHIWDLLTLP